MFALESEAYSSSDKILDVARGLAQAAALKQIRVRFMNSHSDTPYQGYYVERKWGMDEDVELASCRSYKNWRPVYEEWDLEALEQEIQKSADVETGGREN